MKKADQTAEPEQFGTDEELVERVLTGEAEVFARLYERYYARVCRLLIK